MSTPKLVKRSVVVALKFHAETVVEIEVPEDCDDEEVRDAATALAGGMEIGDFIVYDSDLIHVCADGEYIY